MKKLFILFLLFLIEGCNPFSESVIPSRPIIGIEKNAAIIQKRIQPFQLPKEYYEIFKVLKISDTIQVEDLFKNDANIPKETVFNPLFDLNVLLQLAKQIMVSNDTGRTEQEDIECIKRKLVGFANLFVGSTSALKVPIPCYTKSSELAALVASLDVTYTKLYESEPIESTFSESKVNFRKKDKSKQTPPDPCSGGHEFRTDMNIDALNSLSGGNGDSANFTLIENGVIIPTNSNLTRTLFQNTIHPKLHDTNFFKNIVLTTPRTNKNTTHSQKDISILFDKPKPSALKPVDGICKVGDVNKIFFFDNNCMSDAIFTEYEALLEAIVVTPSNGIILLEFGAGSSNSYPAEKEPILFRLIQFASRYKNIVIIEPAGDGGIDFDSMVSYTPKYNPDTICNNTDNDDSGAIIVGGSEATGTIRSVVNNSSKGWKSNFGNRVDCFAQGECVNTNYGNHNSSSAASAIIAGFAIDIQSIAKVRHGRFLTPTQMRYLLKLPSSIIVRYRGGHDKYIPVFTVSFLAELDKLF
jgi:hypothetical protein